MKVLIVDDDRIIREDLRHLIDWQSAGYEIADDAANGAEALEVLQSESIDIILTDIYMPVMNGVELIKAVKKDHESIQILVMSNYDDFSYVKDAMKYGALDYVLKYQLNGSSLLAILNSAASEAERARKEQIEKKYLRYVASIEKKMKQKHLWKNFINTHCSQELILNEAAQLGIDLPAWDFLTIYVKVENQVDINEIDFKNVFEEAVYYPIELEEEIIFLVHFNQKSGLFIIGKMNEIVKKLSICLKATKNIIVYNTNSRCLESLPSEVLKLRNASRFFFYTGLISFPFDQSSDIVRTELNYKEIEELELKIVDAVKSANGVNFEEAEQSLILHIRNQLYAPEIILAELRLLLQRIIKAIGAPCQYTADVQGMLNSLLGDMNNKLITLHDIDQKLKEALTLYFEHSVQGVPDTARKEISKAVNYIQSNYKKVITLAELAEFIALSKNHLCTLFKHETGESFTDYVNKLRINEAKLLMSEKNYHVKEASYEVGISNQRYFCKLFKQYTGYSPMEYKSRRCFK